MPSFFIAILPSFKHTLQSKFMTHHWHRFDSIRNIVRTPRTPRALTSPCDEARPIYPPAYNRILIWMEILFAFEEWQSRFLDSKTCHTLTRWDMLSYQLAQPTSGSTMNLPWHTSIWFADLYDSKQSCQKAALFNIYAIQSIFKW